MMCLPNGGRHPRNYRHIAAALALLIAAAPVGTALAQNSALLDALPDEAHLDYYIEPSDGPPPTLEYMQQMETDAAQWLARLGANDWSVHYKGLNGEMDDNPNAPLPQYIRVSGQGVRLTIGLNRAISADMSAAELQNAVDFVANDGFPIDDLGNEDWRVTAATPSSHITKGITVEHFENGQILLRLRTGFFAVYGQDSRVIPAADAAMPPFGYFQNRRNFSGDVTVEFTVTGLGDTPEALPASYDTSIWRRIGHEAWGRASASSLMGLFSSYADSHLQQSGGEAFIQFRANPASALQGSEGDPFMAATITISGLKEGPTSAERWSGLARTADGQWFLERLYLSQKCAKDEDAGLWTSAPCL